MIRLVIGFYLLLLCPAAMADQIAVSDTDKANGEEYAITSELEKFAEIQARWLKADSPTGTANSGNAVAEMVATAAHDFYGANCDAKCGNANDFVTCTNNALEKCGYKKVSDKDALLCTKPGAVRAYTHSKDQTDLPGYIYGHVEFVCGYEKYCSTYAQPVPEPFPGDRPPDSCWFPSPLPDTSKMVPDIPADAKNPGAYMRGGVIPKSPTPPSGEGKIVASPAAPAAPAATPIDPGIAPAPESVVPPPAATEDTTAVAAPPAVKGPSYMLVDVTSLEPQLLAQQRRSRHHDDFFGNFFNTSPGKYILPFSIGLGAGVLVAYGVDQFIKGQQASAAASSSSIINQQFGLAPSQPGWFQQPNPYSYQPPPLAPYTQSVSYPTPNSNPVWGMGTALITGQSPFNPFLMNQSVGIQPASVEKTAKPALKKKH